MTVAVDWDVKNQTKQTKLQARFYHMGVNTMESAQTVSLHGQVKLY